MDTSSQPSSTNKISTRGRVTYNEATKYAYNTTWFDKVADMDRQYVVNIYVETSEIEIFDVQRKQVFLKRCPFPELDLSKFVLGNAVIIHGRQHNIVSFANEFTKQQLAVAQEKTLAIIKPHAFPQAVPALLQQLQSHGLTITKLQLSQFSSEDVQQFYAEHIGKPFFKSLLEMITAGPLLLAEVVGPQAVAQWREIIGPTDPKQGKGLRSQFGQSITANAFHGSASPEEARRELEIAFGTRPLAAPEGSRTAVIVLQPTFAKQYDQILAEIFAQVKAKNIMVSGIHTADPVAADIDELFKSYQGVIPNWRQYCDSFDDGVCIAIELVGGQDVIAAARDICGPFDPEIARALKPNSIRAKFGQSVVQNAVFVTDIAEEAEIHSDFWFRMME